MSEQIEHGDFKEDIAGGTIPFNFDEGPHDGIKCGKCGEISPEEEFDWVDTIAYRENGEYDVNSVTLLCPNCDEEWVVHMY